MTPFRVGQGYDVHAFADQGDHIVIGGQVIPHERGLLAHSDGDVLLHAICDALLGAAALGDIGHHFPDTDPEYKGADSRKLLRAVKSLLETRGYRIGNIDSTVVAQAPKMAPHILPMRKAIAEDCDIGEDSVSVKATTTEKLGFAGRKEGVACYATVLIYRDNVGVKA
ncbi:2-C-methyl-D-erythritol 2,4-cyclodiphosphate synthase [Hahella sp. CCB-MM4]|uniref:2-C-methyl-D-erythritol 2,4-cyclodiphosphate synthase n=1 Tax=Hahella sp. (strain CCB-MM4) TaxID=1926491 RepID=UPI000B9AA3C3|nr:2-C-methyl-D-erythritol 2,4-cyclodiphosphate synthase [Hahella sp. CCB-MM4]OZG72468.1 2-C-methyl-D-erythritol 2,4-cyclodiphosphate synthase [Hahella sp. CCB-MM4]